MCFKGPGHVLVILFSKFLLWLAALSASSEGQLCGLSHRQPRGADCAVFWMCLIFFGCVWFWDSLAACEPGAGEQQQHALGLSWGVILLSKTTLRRAGCHAGTCSTAPNPPLGFLSFSGWGCAGVLLEVVFYLLVTGTCCELPFFLIFFFFSLAYFKK